MRKKVVTIGIRGKSIRPFLMLFLLVFSTLLQAQEKGEITDSLTQKPKHRVIWVADIESRKPLKNVTIQLDRRTEKVQTEWGGRFVLKNDSFQTMTLTHPSYHFFAAFGSAIGRGRGDWSCAKNGGFNGGYTQICCGKLYAFGQWRIRFL